MLNNLDTHKTHGPITRTGEATLTCLPSSLLPYASWNECTFHFCLWTKGINSSWSLLAFSELGRNVRTTLSLTLKANLAIPSAVLCTRLLGSAPR
jgi:hypothetical protein